MDIDELLSLYWDVRDAHEVSRSLMFQSESICDRIGDAYYNGKADAYEQILMVLKSYLPST